MIWLPHKKYTADHIAAELAEIVTKVRRETRRMVFVAAGAVSVMVVVQATCIYGL